MREKEEYKPSVFFAKRVPFFLLLLGAFTIQACFSSVAVDGVPVNDVAAVKKERRVEKAITAEDKKKLARMSKVRENKVFKQIGGFPEYRIGPLDVLEITSRIGEKAVTSTVTVNALGRIYYSFVDDLDVTGLTPSELDDLLTKRLSQYIKNPRIDIIVKSFNSKTAMVLGEFASLRGGQFGKTPSGRIYLKGKTSLIDFIAQAGGYTERGDIKHLRLTRAGKTYQINLYDIITRGDENLNVIIDEGDVLDIPDLGVFRHKVYVLGEVDNQGTYDLRDAQDLLAAISMAGSITPLAKESNTLIVRATEPGEKPLVMMADVRALLRKGDLSQNIPLKEGDLVYVPPMVIKDVNDFVANMNPLLNFLFWPDRYRTVYWVDNYWKKIRRTDLYLTR